VSGVVTIGDDDNVIVSAFGTAVVESERWVRFKVGLFNIGYDDVAGRGLTVDYATIEETATGEDFLVRSGTLVFDTIDEWIRIPLVNDTVAEPNETLRLVLSNPRGMTINRSSAVSTIIDDDSPPATP
jgi:Calx-beta domain